MGPLAGLASVRTVCRVGASQILTAPSSDPAHFQAGCQNVAAAFWRAFAGAVPPILSCGHHHSKSGRIWTSSVSILPRDRLAVLTSCKMLQEFEAMQCQK